MKKILIALGAALALTAQAAGSFPDKAVNIIVPFPAGGSTDTVARAMALSMGEQLGKPFVVDLRVLRDRFAHLPPKFCFVTLICQLVNYLGSVLGLPGH